MTEQPVEPVTEQEWLRNEAAASPRVQRIAPPKLSPPTPLRPEPVISATRPYEIAQANVLLRKSITAAAKLINARAEAKKAEDAMSAALAAENLAEIDAVEADRALLDFVREAADQ